MMHRIADWSDAYANGRHIADGQRWPDAWVEPARLFREALTTSGHARLDLAYGPGKRHRFDLFLPQGGGEPRGLVVFVHGGYWMALDKSYWSHFAQGPLAHGHAVAMPSYTLCPQARVGQIRDEIARAVEAAAGLVGGPLRLIGHSAGGHLVTRLATRGSPLHAPTLSRLAHVVSLSGLHDLRPLLATTLNETIRLDAAEAAAESPALLVPTDGLRLTCWAGAAERSEFRRQNALLANIWRGLGAATDCVEEPDRHHFDVLDGLADPQHLLTLALLLH